MTKNETCSKTAREWWFDYPCNHRKSMASFYGHSIVLTCTECKRNMIGLFNPESGTFEMDIGPNNTSCGNMSAKMMADLIKNDIMVPVLPDPPSDPNGVSPEQDALRFFNIVSLLKENGYDVLSDSNLMNVDSTNTTITCSCCGTKNEKDTN